MEVKMVSYSNPDGTDWNDDYCDSSVLGKRWKCDLKFTFCFDKSTGCVDAYAQSFAHYSCAHACKYTLARTHTRAHANNQTHNQSNTLIGVDPDYHLLRPLAHINVFVSIVFHLT